MSAYRVIIFKFPVELPLWEWLLSLDLHALERLEIYKICNLYIRV